MNASRDDIQRADIRQLIGDSNLGKRRSFQAGHFLFRVGDFDRSLYALEHGLLAAKYLTPKGTERVKSFFVEGDVVGNLAAIDSGSPNTFSLVCLEDCDLTIVGFDDLKTLAEHNLGVATAVIGVLTRLASKKEKREYEFLCLSAEERYQSLIDSRPDLLDRVKVKDIASYLGVTPVALSRIRTRIGRC